MRTIDRVALSVLGAGRRIHGGVWRAALGQRGLLPDRNQHKFALLADGSGGIQAGGGAITR